MVKARFLAAVILSFVSVVPGQEIQAPKLTPTPQSDKHRDLMREGVALHDRGDFEEAINKYQGILKENPDDIETIYEMGFSYFAKRDYKTSLGVAYQGARYKSRFLGSFYTLVGNNLDHLGQPEQAIKVYREGIKQFPGVGQLHYNLAITLLGVNKPDEARKSLKESLKAAPDHASSHLALSSLYQKGDYKIPALLAACRFLTIEPRSQRSPDALQTVNQILRGNVRKGEDSKDIQVFIDPNGKTDEGDFNALGAALGLVGAARYLEDSKNKTEAQLFVHHLSTLFAIMSEVPDKGSGFAWEYYRPYFCELSRRKLAEPFCYYVLQSSNSEDVNTWLRQNADKVRDFLDWTKGYRWTKR